MKVVDVPGYDTSVVIGPEHGASRLCIFAVAEPAEFAIMPHHHYGEEIFRVLSGRLRFTVGAVTQEIHAAQAVIVPPSVTHSHVVLDDAEVEITGEIGAGIFIWHEQPDGSFAEEELHVAGVPWSRPPRTIRPHACMTVGAGSTTPCRNLSRRRRSIPVPRCTRRWSKRVSPKPICAPGARRAAAAAACPRSFAAPAHALRPAPKRVEVVA
jgi:hypothetical protein